jgi:hypothetical protein
LANGKPKVRGSAVGTQGRRMTLLKCSEPNCPSVLEVKGPVSPNITIRCRRHDEFLGRGLYRRRSLLRGAEFHADGFSEDEPVFKTEPIGAA